MSAVANPYEGLNLPDLMALMHDLVWPEPVAMVPQTHGWWVLMGWSLAVIWMIARRLLLRRRAGRYRRQALAQLKSIAAGAGDDPTSAAAQIAGLLKRTALAVYPREQVASLYGVDWADFLSETCGGDAAVERAAGQFAAAPYRGDVDGRELVGPARRWIKRHRVDQRRGDASRGMESQHA